MRTVKFKAPHSVIKFKDGTPEVNEGNLTIAAFDALIKRNKKYADYFVVTDSKKKDEAAGNTLG
jgi:hypothetical protein